MKKMTKKYLLTTLALSTAFCGLLGVNALTAKADEPSVFAEFGIVETQVRKDDCVGIRFMTDVTDEQKAEATAFGTLVAPKHLVDGELTLGTEQVANIETLIWLDDEENSYAGALVGKDGEGKLTDIFANFYDMELVARAYAIVDGVPVYSNEVVETSIAKEAAIAINNGDGSAILQDIIDEVLGSSFAFAQTEITMTTDDEPVDVALESKGLDYVIENSNPSVASYADGKVTALSSGETTITATIGEKTTTLTVTVELAPLEGTKLATWSSDFISANVTQVKDNNQNGACEVSYSEDTQVLDAGTLKVRSTSAYARFRVRLMDAMSMTYEKVVFYVYVDGNNQTCNGLPLPFGSWTKVEIATTAENYVQITLNNESWDSNSGAIFYVSEIYGVEKANKAEKLLDFTAENLASQLTIGGGNGNAASFENGRVKTTNSTVDGNCNLTFTINVNVNVIDYATISFYVYNVSEPGRTFYYKDNKVVDIYAGATLITLDVSDVVTLKGVAFAIHQSGWQSMKGATYQLSDIYAGEKADNDKLIDFTADSLSSQVTIGGGNGNAASFENGMLKTTNSTVDGNCNLTITLNVDIDVSEYSKIYFYVCNESEPGRTFYYQGNRVVDIYTGFTRVELDVSSLTTLQGVVLQLRQSGWNSMKGAVYFWSDIYGIK